MRSALLWKTKATEPASTEIIAALLDALTPINYELASMQIARFLQHYPRRHIETDAVVIQDLADEIVIRKYGTVPVIEALRELRNEYTENNPWLPQTGKILKTISDHHCRLVEHRNRLTQKPQEETKQIEVTHRSRTWEDFTKEEREHHVKVCEELKPDLREIYMRAFKIPKNYDANKSAE
jgi:hypothetical protein